MLTRTEVKEVSRCLELCVSAASSFVDASGEEATLTLCRQNDAFSVTTDERPSTYCVRSASFALNAS